MLFHSADRIFVGIFCFATLKIHYKVIVNVQLSIGFTSRSYNYA